MYAVLSFRHQEVSEGPAPHVGAVLFDDVASTPDPQHGGGCRLLIARDDRDCASYRYGWTVPPEDWAEFLEEPAPGPLVSSRYQAERKPGGGYANSELFHDEQQLSRPPRCFIYWLLIRKRAFHAASEEGGREV